MLVGYLLLAPPVLLFGPLAGLLLLGPARTVRGSGSGCSRAAAWTALWLNQPGGLAGQFARAGAVLLTGTFLALTSGGHRRASPGRSRLPRWPRAALVVWMWHLGVGWGEVQRAVEHDLWTYNRELLRPAGPGGAVGLAATRCWRRCRPWFAPSARCTLPCWCWPSLARTAARLGLVPPDLRHADRPGTRVVRGVRLQRSADMGLGRGAGALPAAAAGHGGGRGREPAAGAGRCCTRRGAWRSSRRLGAGARAPSSRPSTMVAMFLLPFVVGGLTLLGLADTWLDFRRRLAASAT